MKKVKTKLNLLKQNFFWNSSLGFPTYITYFMQLSSVQKKYSMNMFQDVSELFVSIPMMVGRNV